MHYYTHQLCVNIIVEQMNLILRHLYNKIYNTMMLDRYEYTFNTDDLPPPCPGRKSLQLRVSDYIQPIVGDYKLVTGVYLRIVVYSQEDACAIKLALPSAEIF